MYFGMMKVLAGRWLGHGILLARNEDRKLMSGDPV